MSLEKLKTYIDSINIAASLDQQCLQDIGDKVKLGYEEDLRSMQEWLDDVKKVEELALLKSHAKNTPLPNSANVKLPIITKACLEYSSVAYPEIIKDDKVVQAYILGKDLTGDKKLKATKCTDYMNYQLLIEQQDWQLETDRLLNRLALIGFLCRKTYYDDIRKINKSEICEPTELIINSNVKSLEDALRISHVIHFSMNDLISGKNTTKNDVPVFLEDPINELLEIHKDKDVDECIDLIEQHCWLDLDEDGYKEPYIVTILKENNQVLRIVARFDKDCIKATKDKIERIEPIKCFVDYHFLVSPRGKFQSIGFGLLLLHLTEASNSIVNQLIDSGQLANMRGGYKDARLEILPSGNSLHDPGEWKSVKSKLGMSLKDGFLPIDYREPSSVLYQLLGLLIDVSRDLTSSAEINNGTQSSNNAKTGATLSLQQEGKKTLNSINKRVYRSLTNEFRQLFALNGKYLDNNVSVNTINKAFQVSRKDFDAESLIMYPVADPTLASEQKKIAAAQFAQSLLANPGIDPVKVTKYIIKNSPFVDMEELLVDEDTPQQPNPEALKAQAEIQNMADQVKLKASQLDLEKQRLQSENYERMCRCLELKAKAMLAVAQAQAQENNGNFATYEKELDLLMKQMDHQQGQLQMMHDYTSQQSAQQHEQQLQAQDQMQQQQLQSQDLQLQQSQANQVNDQPAADSTE